MYILSSEQLENAFRLYGVTLETQARSFYGDVWHIIKEAEKAPDVPSLRVHERSLRDVCNDYFSIVKDWRLEQEDLHEESAVCTLSRDNAREAGGALPLFEKQFYRYALCYMELNRAILRARVRISRFIHGHDIEEYGKDLDINSGTGVLLERAHDNLSGIQKKLAQLELMKTLLQASNPLMEDLGASLPKIYFMDGDRELTLFKGALRRSEFTRAEQMVAGWKKERVRKLGLSIVAFFKRHAEELKLGDIIVLHSGELSLPLSVLRSDESKIRDFLEKFNVPYMVFQFRRLLNLGYQLGKIGSIEDLIIQHAKLASLSVRPQTDSDYAKTQQYKVLLPVRTLLETGFPVLAAIFNELETVSATLDKFIGQTRENQTPISP